MFLIERLKEGLQKTRKGITEKIDQLLVSLGKVDEELFEQLEEILITSDVGVKTTLAIIEGLKKKVRENKIANPSEIKKILRDELFDIMKDDNAGLKLGTSPSVIVMVGVNGVGKTTTIGKIAYSLKQQGKDVMFAAADTFRAAAIDQLEVWAQRVGAQIIKHSEGSDPGAVVFDAIHAAKARNADVLICDTAGRLHTKKNLMEELKKVSRIIERELPYSDKESLLVLDATTGQNAISQAKTFKEALNISGIVLTKLDGTAKGGIAITVRSELNIPVKFIGIGEKIEDMQPFDAGQFVDALLM